MTYNVNYSVRILQYFIGSLYEQDDITGQTNLSEGKCCVPKAQNLSKQIPNQDMLLFGCVSQYMSSNVISKAIIDQGVIVVGCTGLH